MKQIGIIAIAFFVVAGCSHTVVGPDGSKVTTSNDGTQVTVADGKGGSATVTSKDGSMTATDSKGNSFSMGAGISEADLGLPFYPGSQEKPNAAMKAEDSGSVTAVSGRTTKDDPAQVIAYYKSRIEEPKDAVVSSGETKSGTVGGKLKDGSEVSVGATKTGSADTEILVTVKHPKK